MQATPVVPSYGLLLPADDLGEVLKLEIYAVVKAGQDLETHLLGIARGSSPTLQHRYTSWTAHDNKGRSLIKMLNSPEDTPEHVDEFCAPTEEMAVVKVEELEEGKLTKLMIFILT